MGIFVVIHPCSAFSLRCQVTPLYSVKFHTIDFLIFTARRNARIASAVLATAIPSVCLSVRPSVCPSVCHTPVLCQNDGT